MTPRTSWRLEALLVVALLVVCVLATEMESAHASGCVTPIAHRGIHNPTTDEDTLPAVRKAFRYGAAEIDAHPTADHRVVIMHDGTVDRTTDGTGWIHDMTLKQVEALRTVKTGARVPTLAQAIRVTGRHRGVLFVDLKERSYWTTRMIGRLDRIVEAHPRATVYMGGKQASFMADLPAYTDHVRIYWRPITGQPFTTAEAAKMGASLVMTGAHVWSPESVQAFRAAGYLTAFRLSTEFARADRLNVDYILTDQPTAACGA